MTDERALDFHGTDTVAGHVVYVIDAAHDPVISVFIPAGAVAGEIHSGNLTPVLFFIPVGIAVDCAQHGRPRLLDDEKSALIGSDGMSLAVDDIGNDTGQRPRCGSGFGGD